MLTGHLLKANVLLIMLTTLLVACPAAPQVTSISELPIVEEYYATRATPAMGNFYPQLGELIDSALPLDTTNNLTWLSWPPPKASSMKRIPENFLGTQPSSVYLKDVDAKLRTILDGFGYTEQSYFLVPGGFAIATQRERVNPDGTIMEDEIRWNLSPASIQKRDVNRFFNVMLRGRAALDDVTAYYRVIVFIVTNVPIGRQKLPTEDSLLLSLTSSGEDRLIPVVGDLSYTEYHEVTALVYEIERPKQTEEFAIVRLPGRHPAQMHLEAIGLWQHFSSDL